MPVSDYEMIRAWTQVLRLSRLQAGQTVTVLTSAATHPQTLGTALVAAQSLGRWSIGWTCRRSMGRRRSAAMRWRTWGPRR